MVRGWKAEGQSKECAYCSSSGEEKQVLNEEENPDVNSFMNCPSGDKGHPKDYI
jgi:hypothetical protein